MSSHDEGEVHVTWKNDKEFCRKSKRERGESEKENLRMWEKFHP